VHLVVVKDQIPVRAAARTLVLVVRVPVMAARQAMETAMAQVTVEKMVKATTLVLVVRVPVMAARQTMATAMAQAMAAVEKMVTAEKMVTSPKTSGRSRHVNTLLDLPCRALTSVRFLTAPTTAITSCA